MKTLSIREVLDNVKEKMRDQFSICTGKRLLLDISDSIAIEYDRSDKFMRRDMIQALLDKQLELEDQLEGYDCLEDLEDQFLN